MFVVGTIEEDVVSNVDFLGAPGFVGVLAKEDFVFAGFEAVAATVGGILGSHILTAEGDGDSFGCASSEDASFCEFD